MELFEHEGLFGYKDNRGKVVIKPQFVYARDFKNGFAVVAIDYVIKYNYACQSFKTPKLFYIDEIGCDVFQQTFESASDFSEYGYAWAKRNSWVDNEIVILPSMGVVNHRGKQKVFKLLKNGWTYIHSCWGHSAKSIGGTTYLFDQNGKVLIKQDCYSVFKSDPDEPELPVFSVQDFSDGLLQISDDEKVFFVDENFNTIFSIPKGKYKSVGNFNRGKAIVEIHKKKFTFFDINTLSIKTIIGIPLESKHKDYLLIDGTYYDKLGNPVLLETLEDQAKQPKFIGDRAIVFSHIEEHNIKRHLYVNIVNRLGKIIIPNVECYYDKKFWAPLNPEKWHSNKWGNTLLIHPNNFVSEIKRDNLMLVVYNEIGEIIFSESRKQTVGLFSNGFLLIANFNENGIYPSTNKFFIDEYGKKYIVDGEKLDYSTFVNGFALVKKPFYNENSPYIDYYLIGYIDTNFEIVIPMKYKQFNSDFGNKGKFYCSDFSCNLARISHYVGEYKIENYYINTKGNKVLAFSEYNDSGDFYNNVTYVAKDGYKIIDIFGNIIIDNISGTILSRSESSIIFHCSLFGFIDKTGKMTIKPNLEDVEGFDDTGKCIVIKNGVNGYIDDRGKFTKLI